MWSAHVQGKVGRRPDERDVWTRDWGSSRVILQGKDQPKEKTTQDREGGQSKQPRQRVINHPQSQQESIELETMKSRTVSGAGSGFPESNLEISITNFENKDALWPHRGNCKFGPYFSPLPECMPWLYNSAVPFNCFAP